MGAPITKIPNLAFTTKQTQFNGLYVPSCTAEQVAAIPRSVLSPGGLLFDTTAEELLTYSAAGFWLPVLTAQSDMDFVNINCETLTANEITTDTITTDTMQVGHIFSDSEGSLSTGTILTDDIIVNHLATAENFRVKNSISGMVGATPTSPISMVLGVGAGTGASASLFGSAISGRLVLNTGSAPAAQATIATFTLPAATQQFTNGVFGAIFYPGSVATGATQTFAVTNSPSGVISFGVMDPLLPAANYIWNYHIITNQIVT